MKIMGRVARLILLVVVSVCVVFCVLCCLQNNPVFSSVTILSHISKNENYELCILAGIITTEKKKIQSSVWRVRDHYNDRKKKVLVVCLVGAQSLLQLDLPKKMFA
jgi:hypothetical protein